MKPRFPAALNLTTPPYNGILWLVWLYIAFACCVAGGGPFSGDLVWFDDRVRLVQILDWLNGADWYNRTISRADYPDGFTTIWSRLVDLPAAAIIAALQPLLGPMKAAMVAAVIIPLLETFLLLRAVAFLAVPLIGKNNANLTSLFVLFSACINPESFTLAGFHVGMLSHHAWYVLLTLVLFGAVARMMQTSDPRPIAVAGWAIGGLLTVGIEGLPLIAGVYAVVAVIGFVQERKSLVVNAARSTAVGAIAGFALLPTHQPFAKLFTVSYTEPSILGPALLCAATQFLTAEWAILEKFRRNRWLAGGLIMLAAMAIAIILMASFPRLSEGAAAALTPEEWALARAEHHEAKPLFIAAGSILEYFRLISLPLLAALFAVYRIVKSGSPMERALYGFYLGLLLMTFALASIYARYFPYLELMSCPWLVMIWDHLNAKYATGRWRPAKVFGAFVLLAPMWWWILPTVLHHGPFDERFVLFPARLQLEPPYCDTKGFDSFLDQHYDAAAVLLTPMYQSDRFLLHTHLNLMFLASFPSNNRFIDAKAFYETRDANEAAAIVVKHKVDLVAVCSSHYLVSPQTTFANQLLKGRMTFGQMLAIHQPPEWLKPVEVPPGTPWLLFEVDRARLPAHG